MADVADILRKMSSDWPILTKLGCKLLRGCYTKATYLATLQKVEDHSTFLATCNATISVAKWGVIREFFPAICNATNVALQVARKIASCNMAFTREFFLATCNATFVTLQVARKIALCNMALVKIINFSNCTLCHREY